MTAITEADIEQAALDWLRALGWQVAHVQDVAAGGATAAASGEGLVGRAEYAIEVTN